MGICRLLTGPVGPGSTFSVLAAAEEAARAGRSFALVLPTRAARDHARNELARRTGQCDPRSVYTFPGLARRLLGASAPRLATQRERDALLATALAGQTRAPNALPEHELALRFRGFRRGLLHVFEELEVNGLAAAALERKLRAARLDPARARRLTWTYEGYRRLLREARLSTQADLLGAATQSLIRGKAAITVPELLLLDGFTDLSPRQLDLLQALSQAAVQTDVTWPVADAAATTGAFSWPDRTRRRLSEDLEFAEVPRAEAEDSRPPLLRHLAHHTFAEALPAPLDDHRGLKVVRAASRRDEVEYALARAREFVTASPDRRWTDVLLVVPDVRRYRPILEQVGRELSVPVRARGAVPLSSSPLVRGALAFLRAAATYELAPLLVAAACPAFGLTPAEADRLARAARRRGLPAQGSPELWVTLADELGGPAASLLGDALALGRELEGTAIPDGNGRISSRAGARSVQRTLERLLRPIGVQDLCAGDVTPEAVAVAAAEVAARRDLLALLADLERLDVPLPPTGHADVSGPQQLVARIDEEVRATESLPRDRRRHVLHAVDAREARAWEADLVLVLGLVEKEFPRPPHDDLFLPEETRRALSRRSGGRGKRLLALRTGEERAAEDVFLFMSAITRARKELWLLYPGFGPGGDPLRPSRFLDAVRGVLTDDAWQRASVLRNPGDLVSDEPELLLTENAMRRFAYRRVSSVSRPTGPEAPRVQLATALFRSLISEPGEMERAALALRRPDARFLPAPLGKEAVERVYSASELETYATCPFRHFVRYLLGVRPADDLAESGLDALRRGTVVHNALQRIYERGEEPERALAVEFRKGARELDIEMEEDAFRRQALESLRAFVNEDDPAFRRSAGLEPFGFEVPFGPEAPGGALEIEAPGLGGTIRLRGKIDRIDVRGEGEERAGFVTDYKLGGREVDGNYLDGMYKGERLQVAIYLLALKHVLGIRPMGAGFAALGTRRRTGVVDPQVAGAAFAGLDERQVRLHGIPLERVLPRIEEQVRRFVGGIADGMLEPAPLEASDCDRCDARDVCRTDVWEARRRARRGRPLQLARR